MSNRVDYFRTFQDGTQSVHLEGVGDAYTLCGVDTAGDDLVHEKPPQKLAPGRHRVTCEHCQHIMRIVDQHRGRDSKE